MTNTFALPRRLIVLAIVLPLAALIGLMLATPTDLKSLAIIGVILSVLATPIFLRWHHPILVFSWNAAIAFSFLPGNMHLWVIMAFVSLGVTLLSRILNKEMRLVMVPSVSWTLLAFLAVVLITAKLAGGLGVRALGSGVFGGKKYFYILFAVVGYFALSLQRIPLAKANFYSGLFFLSGTTSAVSNLIYFAGPSFYFLYLAFPVELALTQAHEDFIAGLGPTFGRVTGLPWAGLAVVSYMVLRFGVRGLLDLTKPWRLLSLGVVAVLSLFGGFRSIVVLYALILVIQFYLEGLFRTRYFATLFLAGLLGFVALIPTAHLLPLAVQRSLSILPVQIDAAARADAQGSINWRVKMWNVLVPQIPDYFWRGKGYTANATDYYMVQESTRRGFGSEVENALLAGDYHNGPLSIIIPFGIWGVLAFVAFIAACWRVLLRNFRYGDPAIKHVNTFLLALFVARLIFFLVFFGAVHSDIAIFAGLTGLSIALNGGMRTEKST